MLYTLSLYSATCQLYFNKIEKNHYASNKMATNQEFSRHEDVFVKQWY